MPQVNTDDLTLAELLVLQEDVARKTMEKREGAIKALAQNINDQCIAEVAMSAADVLAAAGMIRKPGRKAKVVAEE